MSKVGEFSSNGEKTYQSLVEESERRATMESLGRRPCFPSQEMTDSTPKIIFVTVVMVMF